jgi:hypothetical protein
VNNAVKLTQGNSAIFGAVFDYDPRKKKPLFDAGIELGSRGVG